MTLLILDKYAEQLLLKSTLSSMRENFVRQKYSTTSRTTIQKRNDEEQARETI